MPAKKKDLKLLFVNPCLRRGGFTKLLPVGLGSVMTYFKKHNYDFSLLDIDINEFDDEYVEHYIKKSNFDFVLIGTLVTHYKWMKWFVNTVKENQPNTRNMVKDLGKLWNEKIDTKALFDLFPGNPSKQAGRIAGLRESRRKGGY